MQRSVFIISMMVLTLVSVQGAELSERQQSAERKSLVDYLGFLALSQEVEHYRRKRLLSVAEFVKKSKEKKRALLF